MGVTQFRAPTSPQRPPPAPRYPELWPAWLPRRGALPGFPRGAARAPGAGASTRQAPPPERPLSQRPPLHTPPNTPWEQAPEPWAPGPLRVRLVLSLPPERRGPVVRRLPGNLHPVPFLRGAPSGAGMWAIVGGTEAAVGAARGFFIWQLLPPCLSRAWPGGLQKGQLSGLSDSGSFLFELLGDRSCSCGCF